jgi:hypothetical protein
MHWSTSNFMADLVKFSAVFGWLAYLRTKPRNDQKRLNRTVGFVSAACFAAAFLVWSLVRIP